jgi:hypothetical protein
MTQSWLGRSRQRWLLQVEFLCGVSGIAMFLLLPLLGVALRRPALSSLAIGGIPLLTVSVLLPLFIRCRVCGLRLRVSEAARARPSAVRLVWLRTLEVCPVCGDDGAASGASREKWATSGRPAEGSSWLVRAILLTCLGVVVASACLIAFYELYRVQ